MCCLGFPYMRTRSHVECHPHWKWMGKAFLFWQIVTVTFSWRRVKQGKNMDGWEANDSLQLSLSSFSPSMAALLLCLVSGIGWNSLEIDFGWFICGVICVLLVCYCSIRCIIIDDGGDCSLWVDFGWCLQSILKRPGQPEVTAQTVWPLLPK